MIVVAGGTGMLGTLLVRRLVDRHVAVRVLTRELNRARHFGHLPVEIVRADVRDPGTLTAAVEGAETVVSAIHGFVGSGVSPMSIDQTGNSSLIDAAAKVGASFVLMSVVGARRSSPFELFRAKYAAEEHMQSTAVEGTVVRATAFVETWAKIMDEASRDHGNMIVFGRGDNPINFVSVHDVAALLELVVMDHSLRGRVLEIGGPENATLRQIAALIQEVAHRPGRVRHVPRFALRTIATLMKHLKPELSRQANAAHIMDRILMTFESTEIRHALPALPTTDINTAINRYFHPSTLG